METKFPQYNEEVWVHVHLGRKIMTKHQINLNSPHAPLIHTNPYRAGLRQREFGQGEVEQRLKVGVAEPVVTEWASPSYSSLLKTALCGFVATIVVWMR